MHELFTTDEVDKAMIEKGILPDASALKDAWLEHVKAVMDRATLRLPEDDWMPSGGRTGQHTEHLAYLLAEMQVLPRTYPDAKW